MGYVMSSEQVFLFSSYLENPDSFFQGYCFVGSDYIYGDGGAKAFATARGSFVGPDEDGCYVSVTKVASGYTFHVDFSGNKKLYYSWTPRYWAVSNSIATLVDHLRANQVPVTPNFAQLLAAGYGEKSSALNQATAYTTIVNEVRLVPLGTSLTIGAGGLSITRNPTNRPTLSYSEALAHYCGLWVSRLATLVASGVDVRSDLTGGVDSRAVVALLQAALRLGGTNESGGGVGVRSGTTPGNVRDLEIATSIASSLGLPLNERGHPRGLRLSSDETYDVWRRLSLGVYHPVYFPRSSPDAYRVALGGGGGENHRPFYKDESFTTLIDRCARRLPVPWLAAQFRGEMTEAGAQLASLAGGNLEPLIAHYRHFRNRFHTGRAPQQAVLFSPLASRALEEATECVSGELRHNGQVNYDIIASVAPELLEFEFDSPRKELTAERAAALTVVSLEDRFSPGEVYVAMSHRESGASGARGSRDELPLNLMMAEFVEAATHPVVEEFWGASRLIELRRRLDSAVSEGALRHAIDGQPVAAVLASYMVLR